MLDAAFCQLYLAWAALQAPADPANRMVDDPQSLVDQHCPVALRLDARECTAAGRVALVGECINETERSWAAERNLAPRCMRMVQRDWTEFTGACRCRAPTSADAQVDREAPQQSTASSVTFGADQLVTDDPTTPEAAADRAAAASLGHYVFLLPSVSTPPVQLPGSINLRVEVSWWIFFTGNLVLESIAYEDPVAAITLIRGDDEVELLSQSLADMPRWTRHTEPDDDTRPGFFVTSGSTYQTARLKAEQVDGEVLVAVKPMRPFVHVRVRQVTLRW